MIVNLLLIPAAALKSKSPRTHSGEINAASKAILDPIELPAIEMFHSED